MKLTFWLKTQLKWTNWWNLNEEFWNVQIHYEKLFISIQIGGYISQRSWCGKKRLVSCRNRWVCKIWTLFIWVPLVSKFIGVKFVLSKKSIVIWLHTIVINNLFNWLKFWGLNNNLCVVHILFYFYIDQAKPGELVNTPRSLQACILLGVDPSEIQYR